MNQAYRAHAPGLWPALQETAQTLFRNGTEHISLELPLGELALSVLDIEQRARNLGKQAVDKGNAPAAIQSPELPIGELALSALAIGQRALQLGLTGSHRMR